MKIREIIDIIGRFLIMGWTWVYINEFVEGQLSQFPTNIILTIFIIWWSIIPFLNKKDSSSYPKTKGEGE